MTIRRLHALWPFLGGGAAAFATLPLGAGGAPIDGGEAVAAGILFGGVAVAALLPWERLPQLLGALPVLASFAAIALLRDAVGGASSGYGPLVLLPVLWLALHRPRRELLVSFAVVAALFVAPIPIEPDRYPAEEWRKALLWMIVTAIVGLTTSALVTSIRESARVDPLTGLANRRAWQERLALALTLSARSGLPLSVAFFDLDGFKAYNDSNGHLAGDLLLVRAATAWRAEVRRVDLLARLGGDEFALLLPDASLAEAEVVVARTRAATPDIGCSAGIAEWDREESGEELLRRADRALYAEKVAQAGRLGA